ncbi:MAG: ATP-binding cassette domain-containing protein [Candidatus Pacebacteria bacterium]|nr:ATP-binding cassette domain-containing protein [Candidatus Paceibacterota bacterium]
MITVENLTKKYSDFVALSNVSFQLEEGEIVGILGPNGAGKTTLLRILVAFFEFDSGEVTIDGLDISNPLMQQKIKSKIGYLPEHAPLYDDMTVLEYLQFVGKMQGIDTELDEKVFSVIAKCGLKEKKNAEISTLSKGYRQRVGIAQALIHDPKIVILDEPTTGLDPKQRIEIRDLIKEIGKTKTVILSSHILPEVHSTCSRVLILNNGKIKADDTPEGLENMGQADSRIHIELDRVPENFVSKLNSHEMIKGVEVSGNNIVVITENKVDLRQEVAKMIIENEIGLLELIRKQADLEDIFISLTKNDE